MIAPEQFAILLGWALLAECALTCLLIVVVIVVLIFQRREESSMAEENVKRLEDAAASLEDSAAKARLFVTDLQGANSDLKELVDDLRRQLSDGGQIDPTRLDAISERLERTNGIVTSIFTPAPGDTTGGDTTGGTTGGTSGEGLSVIEIARRAESAAGAVSGESAGSGGTQAPGTVASEQGGS